MAWGIALTLPATHIAEAQRFSGREDRFLHICALTILVETLLGTNRRDNRLGSTRVVKATNHGNMQVLVMGATWCCCSNEVTPGALGDEFGISRIALCLFESSPVQPDTS